MHATYPALTPLTANAPDHAALSGISLTVSLSARVDGRRQSATGGFLFTHKGYSGPSVLDLSHLAVRSRLAGGARQEITVQWTDLDAAAWEERLRAGGTVHVGTLVRRALPERLAEMILKSAEVDGSTPASQLKREARIRLVAALSSMPLPWTGDEGYKKAEVTGGGVALTDDRPGHDGEPADAGGCSCAERCWTRSGRSGVTTSLGVGDGGGQRDWERRQRQGNCDSVRRNRDYDRIVSRTKAYRKGDLPQVVISPAGPAWPAPMLVRSSNRLVSVFNSRSFAVHFAGSQ
jgi:hypothetical protein